MVAIEIMGYTCKRGSFSYAIIIDYFLKTFLSLKMFTFELVLYTNDKKFKQ